ncbi:hypothetical protein AhnVgp062 [Adoxophyes honmai nucleopolyhedrovirus]|uniref:Ac78-like protein n=1 Tax=Adoxophyes honmai nucleopolyhedrovirus TaxID=224399 RepID=Q80LN4_NPVAH|nr:hypothetical protein AhnVgp062 [Adoxophyes honmai nucleopolyhedrovirus]BAC67313.1 hypothetical protein [Adoxophyes honmai nucleopolyhedrovirus]
MNFDIPYDKLSSNAKVDYIPLKLALSDIDENGHTKNNSENDINKNYLLNNHIDNGITEKTNINIIIVSLAVVLSMCIIFFIIYYFVILRRDRYSATINPNVVYNQIG